METHHVTDLTQESPIEAKVHEGIPSCMTGIPPLGYDLNSCAMRFRSAAKFGIALDMLILFISGAAVLAGFKPATMGLLYTLIEVPVIWGILGIFFYTEMLDLAGDFMQRARVLLRVSRFFR